MYLMNACLDPASGLLERACRTAEFSNPVAAAYCRGFNNDYLAILRSHVPNTVPVSDASNIFKM